MLDEREIKAYKSISAPSELYDKVIGATSNNKKPVYLTTVKFLSAVAASLILICAISYFIKAPSVQISINGQKLENTIAISASDEQPMMRALPISASISSLDMDIDVQNKTKVTVSHGEIIVSNTEASAEVILDKPTSISWVFSSTETDDCKMHITSENEATVITLTYDEANNKIIATKNTK